MARDLISYVVEYLNRLRDTHPACIAFGAPLRYFYQEYKTNPKNTLFPFGLPLSTEDNMDTGGDLGIYDGGIKSDNKNAIAIVPAGGAAPFYAMGAWNPIFSLICRHEVQGCAYQCLQELTYELNDNARVFPQNGTILSIQSQPARLLQDRRGLSVWKTVFRVLAAEPIR